MTDPEFLAERARVRMQLEYEQSPELTDRHRRLDEEFLRRARIAWQGKEVNATQAFATPAAPAACMLAVEIPLAEPEALGDDVLESCLYLLRERLNAA